ncbi:N-acetyl-gamma-glutamyl-phosphate reductase [Rhodovulum sp. DZ06]|uniref:N-acetyl-gamma-glutamyl-phosphate reductase n=1 Tax=Rhodovulum sp. DZ06 TaxID=3425126 RepID=UPI003D3304AF
MTIVRTAILGASGYTGAELTRLLLSHPNFRIDALTANSKAGQTMSAVYPQFSHCDLPVLTTIEDVDWSAIDVAFCALPHATTQEVIASIPEAVKVVDLSADFRLRDVAMYAKWYGHEHMAPELQKTAVYGLPEFYREELKTCRLAAGTGCFVVDGLLPLVPLLEASVIDPDDIVIDSKTGITGAGRAAAEWKLFSEVTEGTKAYGIASHRHTSEFDQELSKAAGREVKVSFTPHLLPMNRGILGTIYVKGDAAKIHETLAARYADEPFVEVMPMGEAPTTWHVKGSNLCRIGVVADRRPGRAILVSVIDNLVKGASGQAVQVANIMCGLPEDAGLTAAPMFP